MCFVNGLYVVCVIISNHRGSSKPCVVAKATERKGKSMLMYRGCKVEIAVWDGLKPAEKSAVKAYAKADKENLADYMEKVVSKTEEKIGIMYLDCYKVRITYYGCYGPVVAVTEKAYSVENLETVFVELYCNQGEYHTYNLYKGCERS